MTETKTIFPQKEKYNGVYIPANVNVTFSREWGEYRFTDDECKALLRGEEIAFETMTKTHRPYKAVGKLKKRMFNGHSFWGFSLVNESIPNEWSGHVFTDEEYDTLQKGGTIYIPDAISKKNGKPYSCVLSFSEVEGKKRLIPNFG